MPFTDLMDSIRGWGRTATLDGIRLAAPTAGHGTVSIHRKVSLRPVTEMLAEHARTAWSSNFAPVLGPATLFATSEGEHACTLTATVTGPSGPVRYHIGVVIGDEHAAIIDATSDEAHFAKLGEMTRMFTEFFYLALGATRQRKYEYEAPEGWKARRHLASTWWYHPEYPRKMAIIKVFDARSTVATAPDVLDYTLFLTSSIVDDEPPTQPIACRTPRNLMGHIVRGTGTLGTLKVAYANVYYTDERFAYYVRLETQRDLFPEVGPVMAKVVESVSPVPAQRLKAQSMALIHWAE